MGSRVLYFGLDPTRFVSRDRDVVHCPLIETRPLPSARAAFRSLAPFTHLLFTSRQAIPFFFEQGEPPALSTPTLAVGRATAALARSYGLANLKVAQDERAEGLFPLLAKLPPTARLLWPHSLLSRRVIPEFLNDKEIYWQELLLYETRTRRPRPLPDLSQYEELVFTSPSIVDAFVEVFGPLPDDKILTCIGPVTQDHLNRSFASRNPS